MAKAGFITEKGPASPTSRSSAGGPGGGSAALPACLTGCQRIVGTAVNRFLNEPSSGWVGTQPPITAHAGTR